MSDDHVAAVAAANEVNLYQCSNSLAGSVTNSPYQSLQVFARRLYQLLKDKPGNIVISPFILSGGMGMVAHFYLSLEYFLHHNSNLYDWLKVAAGAGGNTLVQCQQGMSFPR